jgi:hypothetical protein
MARWFIQLCEDGADGAPKLLMRILREGAPSSSSTLAL